MSVFDLLLILLVSLLVTFICVPSASDNFCSHYRSIDEVNYWNKEDSPVGRLGLYLMKRKIWDSEMEQSHAKEVF